MAKIQHVAMFVKDIQVTKNFYEKAFGFRAFNERDGGDIVDAKVVDLTDESLVITLVEPADKEAMRAWQYLTWGVNHIGILVDDIHATRAKIQELGIEIPAELIEYKGQFFTKFHDPNGSEIDLVDATFTDWAIPPAE
jgi:catechol 2,3-dioxygenase-like lactoylglutathione lyase family enzyme